MLLRRVWWVAGEKWESRVLVRVQAFIVGFIVRVKSSMLIVGSGTEEDQGSKGCLVFVYDVFHPINRSDAMIQQ